MVKRVYKGQQDLKTLTLTVTDNFEDALYMAANEPSIGLYRIYEHIGKTVPAFVNKKV